MDKKRSQLAMQAHWARCGQEWSPIIFQIPWPRALSKCWDWGPWSSPQGRWGSCPASAACQPSAAAAPPGGVIRSAGVLSLFFWRQHRRASSFFPFFVSLGLTSSFLRCFSTGFVWGGGGDRGGGVSKRDTPKNATRPQDTGSCKAPIRSMFGPSTWGKLLRALEEVAGVR